MNTIADLVNAIMAIKGICVVTRFSNNHEWPSKALRLDARMKLVPIFRNVRNDNDLRALFGELVPRAEDRLNEEEQRLYEEYVQLRKEFDAIPRDEITIVIPKLPA